MHVAQTGSSCNCSGYTLHPPSPSLPSPFVAPSSPSHTTNRGSSPFSIPGKLLRNSSLALIFSTHMDYFNLFSALSSFFSREFSSLHLPTLLAGTRLLSDLVHRFETEDALPGIPLDLDATKAELPPILGALRFAFACYGGAGRAFLEISSPKGSRSLVGLGALGHLFTSRESAFAALAHIPRENVLLHGGGTLGTPRCFVAIDHSEGAVVVAVRGTMSLHDCLIDALGDNIPFCGGFGHKGMVNAALNVWELVKAVVLDNMSAHPGYTLLLTGHSLGGGASTLLYIKLQWEIAQQGQGHPLSATRMACTVFASPPVFAPIDELPSPVRSTCVNVVCRADMVPRMSVHSIRELLRVSSAWKEHNPILPTFLWGAKNVRVEDVLGQESGWLRSYGCGRSLRVGGCEGGGGQFEPITTDLMRLEHPGRILVFRVPHERDVEEGAVSVPHAGDEWEAWADGSSPRSTTPPLPPPSRTAAIFNALQGGLLALSSRLNPFSASASEVEMGVGCPYFTSCATKDLHSLPLTQHSFSDHLPNRYYHGLARLAELCGTLTAPLATAAGAGAGAGAIAGAGAGAGATTTPLTVTPTLQQGVGGGMNAAEEGSFGVSLMPSGGGSAGIGEGAGAL